MPALSSVLCSELHSAEVSEMTTAYQNSSALQSRDQAFIIEDCKRLNATAGIETVRY